MTAPPLPIVTVTTARGLLTTGACTAACLLAVAPDPACSCRCGGRHHGVLADAPVSLDENERNAA